MARSPKVIILGGGFGGLNAAKGLRSARCDVLIVDQTNYHLFQPLLYEVASAVLSPGEIAVPIREIVRKQKNTSVIMGQVVEIDKGKKQITLLNGEKITYDYLIIAVGARHSYFGNDQWEQFAPGLKTIQDALTLRDKILISFEKGERLGNGAKAAKHLNFMIIGGGPTGVEMAGAIAQIAHKTLCKNFRRIRPEHSCITLVEAAPYILPTYPEALSLRAKRDLEALGVSVITGKKVTDITAEGVQIEDQFYPCTNVIWAAGNQASPLLKTLNIPLDRQGRALVGEDLSIPDHPEVFVIGDAAAVMKEGKPLPGVAPMAIQTGRYVAQMIRLGIPKEQRPPFRYVDKGSLATIGQGKAIALFGKIQLTGFVAWGLWCFVHIAYLIGFRSRLSVMLEWFFFYFTGQRGARLIYSSIDTSKW